ncbi:hypothetical protein IAR50_006860 [Cryptococcus sp. DSM 104548]
MAEITPPPSQNNTPLRTFPPPAHPQGSQGPHASGLGANEATVPPPASALSSSGTSAGAGIPEDPLTPEISAETVPAGDSMDVDDLPSPSSSDDEQLYGNDAEAVMMEPEGEWDGEGDIELDMEEGEGDSEVEEAKGKGKGKAKASTTKKRSKRTARRLPQQNQSSHLSRLRQDYTERRNEGATGSGGRREELYESDIVQRWNNQFGDVLGPAPKSIAAPAPAHASEPEPEVAPVAPDAFAQPTESESAEAAGPAAKPVGSTTA